MASHAPIGTIADNPDGYGQLVVRLAVELNTYYMSDRTNASYQWNIQYRPRHIEIEILHRTPIPSLTFNLNPNRYPSSSPDVSVNYSCSGGIVEPPLPPASVADTKPPAGGGGGAKITYQYYLQLSVLFMQSLKRKMRRLLIKENRTEDWDNDCTNVWSAFFFRGCPCCASITGYPNWFANYGVDEIVKEFQAIELNKRKYYHLYIVKSIAIHKGVSENIESCIFTYL